MTKRKTPHENTRNPFGITTLAEYRAEKAASEADCCKLAPRVAHSTGMFDIWVRGYYDQDGKWHPPRLDPENPTKANPEYRQNCGCPASDVAPIEVDPVDARLLGLLPDFDPARTIR